MYLKQKIKTGILISILAAALPTMTSQAGTWLPAGDHWEYQNDDGTRQANGWFQDENGKSYYFDGDGRMLYNTVTPDGYRVGPDGAWDGAGKVQQPVTSIRSNKKDVYYQGLRSALDAIPLYPMETTGDGELDELLNSIFSQIITSDMDTHDKLKACYDYIINHTVYGLNSVWGDSYAMAYGLLRDGQGVCDDYSAAFAVMARKIGVPVYTVAGETHKSNGDFTPHAWCQLDFNGVTYIFDPEVEDVISNSQGYIMYIRFGGTTAQLADKYHGGDLYDDFSETAAARSGGEEKGNPDDDFWNWFFGSEW